MDWIDGHSFLGLSVFAIPTRIVSNVQSRFAMPASEPFGLLRHHARRPHHIDHAGGEAKQQEYDEAPGRGRQQTIETPAESLPGKNTRNQFGGEAKPDGHGGCPGLSRVLLVSGLVRPDFSAALNFGQPVIQTSEPCGKRGFVGGRFIATSISAVIRAFSHAAETRNDACVDGNDAPSPSKAARTILTASSQVKIAS